MSDIGELFNDIRKVRQEKRASNRDNSAQMLAEEGINFRSNNGGAHLIVEHNGLCIDFWPGTGLWCVRKSNEYRRGVRGLIKFIQKHVARKAGAE